MTRRRIAVQESLGSGRAQAVIVRRMNALRRPLSAVTAQLNL